MKEWLWKPISKLDNDKDKDVAICCSRKCEEKWQEVLICPDCNTDEYTKTTGVQSYPSLKVMWDQLSQYHLRLLQKSTEGKITRGSSHKSQSRCGIERFLA